MMAYNNAPKNKEVYLSIIVPVYNEEESLKPLFSEILQIIVPLNFPYEIIFINDGSSDDSLSIINEFKLQFPEVVEVCSSSNRSGQTSAMKEGFSLARGKVIVTLDADLQNDPRDIPKLLTKLKEGFDCVCGWRKSRQDTRIKAFFSKSGNMLQRILTGFGVHDLSCTLRIYKKECVGKIALTEEGQHRFIPLSLFLQGYKVGEVIANHRMRKYGVSKYSHKRLVKVVIDFLKIIVTRGKE